MSDIITLLLMIGVPFFLFLAVKKRVKQESSWKLYAGVAAGIFVLLIIIAKM
ncbi:hypothetical protein [Pelosinus sp. IPA-1]|uniref:hypothetical protein n=1 Tax=Pelosinus sp. IPA-1 TaxID=3029569 RepID=UPI0024362A41|nr:hypothetical protein [Pelosinus sp. IPA-1]GMA97477.1 hypothetical protein PIPA1_02770 [Pelosinus sp. IPA-1]